MKVVCPYCGNRAKLVSSFEIYGAAAKDYGMFWQCWPCDAYVGTHKNSAVHMPLGRLANKDLREWRRRAHSAFDPLWKSGRMKRKDAYALMCTALEIQPHQAHIGKFNVVDCKRLVEWFEVEWFKVMRVGAKIRFPGHVLRVVDTGNFERHGAFQDAVARVVVEEGPLVKVGMHIRTPWGMVQVINESRANKLPRHPR